MEVLDKYLLDNGVISTKEAEKLGIKRHILAKLVKENKLERVKYGLYKNKEDFLDEYILISSNNNKVIFPKLQLQFRLFCKSLIIYYNAYILSSSKSYSSSGVKYPSIFLGSPFK